MCFSGLYKLDCKKNIFYTNGKGCRVENSMKTSHRMEKYCKMKL